MPDADKTTPRPNAYGTPWEYENVSVCSDRSAHGVVKDDNGKVLFDSMNSDVATIATEHDEHGATYFDTAGHYYLSHAVRCVNAHDALVAVAKEAVYFWADDFPDGPDSDNAVTPRYRAAYKAALAALKLAEAP